ncbi:hypothetical protein [Agromyces mariniharenae]|uniref:Protein kinase domain-containing protein n=1 Tax=Agromyces mariniharenae TaxID=2604423 RepID=A0A5S4UWK5_9MICO|nr:hypothetical protein [Agromyces mariniharenae]TYL50956.1 hypothetical protein FYC51_17610 [Agromyces mariniharenae]
MSRRSRRERRTERIRESSDRIVDAAPLDGRLVGYRLIRRIASGDRADVYLAAVGRPVPTGRDGGEPAGRSTDVAGGSTGVAGGAHGVPALVVLRVYDAEADDAAIACELEAMSTDAAGALPRLHDVATLPDGRCCVVVERLGGGSLARTLSARTITAGEAVTILAPIVVAVGDLASRGYAHTRLAVSDIVFDDAGRPRLLGLGALRRMSDHGAERTALRRVAHERLADLVEDVAAAVMPPGALGEAIELVRARLAVRPFAPCEAELERRLFELATPEPVREVATAASPRRLPGRVMPPTVPLTEEERAGATMAAAAPRTAGGMVGTGLRRWLALAQAPEGVIEQFAAAADVDRVADGRKRLTGLIRARGRAVAVGALLGGATLVTMLTLVPPAGADGGRVAEASGGSAGEPVAGEDPVIGERRADGPAEEPSGTPETEAAAPPSSVDDLGESPPDGVVAAARDLLGRRAECFAALDLACLGTVVQPGSAIEASDRAALVAARDGEALPQTEFDPATVEVVAEMGGAVLVRARATPEREPASLLMVRGEAGWRLREVFD